MSQTKEKKRTLLRRSKRLKVEIKSQQRLKRRNLRTNSTPRKVSTRRKASSIKIRSRTKVIRWSYKQTKSQLKSNSVITKTPRITAIRTLLKLVDPTNQTSYLPRDLPTIRTQKAMRVRGSNSTNSSNIETVLKNTRKRVHSSRSRRTSTPSLMITAIS